MPSYVYKPKCPYADEHGFVEKNELYYMWLSMCKPDNRMMKGNVPVTMNFIQDEMPPTRHMVNGKYYTSKKKFRDETKARGCVEIGNETKYLTKPRGRYKPDRKQIREDLRKSIYELKNGRDIKTELKNLKYD